MPDKRPHILAIEPAVEFYAFVWNVPTVTALGPHTHALIRPIDEEEVWDVFTAATITCPFWLI
jgi:hypothetical protein